MTTKPSFKLTEIGWIPEDWEVKKLKEIGKVVTGGTPPTKIKEYWGEDFIWITPTDISDKKTIFESERQITKKALEIIGDLPAGSVLVTCIASIGKNAIIGKRGGCNQQINAIIPNNGYDSEFLYYLFENSKPYLQGFSAITATAIIPKSLFENIPFPFPPLPEQHAIANVLSDVDKLIDSLDELIEKKQAIKKATMHLLLTGKKRLPGFTGEWVKRKLGEIGLTYNGITGKKKEDFGQGNAKYIPFLNLLNNTVINTNDLELVNILPYESQNIVKNGDILFNGSSETPEEVGMASLFLSQNESNPVYLNSFCFGYRLFNPIVNPLFVVYFFRSEEGRKLLRSLAQGATRYNLSKTAFLKLEIPVPSIDEQQAIAQVLSDMDSEIEALQAKRDKLKQLKQGMMQVLLTGKIRLVETSKEAEV